MVGKMKKLLFLLFIFSLMVTSAQARCIDNRSNARVKVDISFMYINRIQEWVKPKQVMCYPYNFVASVRLDAVDTPEYGVALSGEATYFLTTNNTRIIVTEGKRWHFNGVTHVKLAFSRED
jgi:hypothetical protein